MTATDLLRDQGGGSAKERDPRDSGEARSASETVIAGTSGGWYKDAVIYEIHVRAFRDADGDGIGDFKGLIEKLDYLQGLGVTALWLLPFYPSPLRDDGYDISDYRRVHPCYGTLRDFRRFLSEAHRRGMRVITELVLAHTSDAHRVVPASPPVTTGLEPEGLLHLERHARQVLRRPRDLQGLRGVELVVRPGGRGLLLAPVLLAPAEPQL